MIAAIYARKSSEQRNVDEEQKSVTRQIEHARQYARRKGWTVDDGSIFVDDGISGAEFANRPGFVRLMNALKPRPRFQVLIMSEEARLGREAIETAYALKQLMRAGVHVWFYLDDRERTLDSPMEKAMLALQSMSDEMEREKARQRTYDAMRRKFEQGQVTGGQCFGYRNVDVLAAGPDGRSRRQFVRREVDDVQAAVIRQIFELCAMGEGLKRITKALNEAGAPAPRAQRARPNAWAPSSVREVLYREAYRGIAVWNKTRKRNIDGAHKVTDREESDWMRTDAEHLRIVSDALWQVAHGRLTERRENYQRWTTTGARQALDPRGSRLSYLLSGFARCAVCGGSMQAKSSESRRTAGTVRVFRYGCGNYGSRGAAVCGNQRSASLAIADTAIRHLLAREVLRPAVLEQALDLAVEMLRADTREDERTRRREELTRRLAALEGALANLADTAARGGAVPVILDALTRKDQERRALVDEIAALQPTTPAPVPLEPRILRRQLRQYLDQWQAITAASVPETRALLGTVLRGRIAFQPIAGEHGAPMYELTIPLRFDRLLVTAVPSLAGAGRIGVPKGKSRRVFTVRTAAGAPAAGGVAAGDSYKPITTSASSQRFSFDGGGGSFDGGACGLCTGAGRSSVPLFSGGLRTGAGRSSVPFLSGTVISVVRGAAALSGAAAAGLKGALRNANRATNIIPPTNSTPEMTVSQRVKALFLFAILSNRTASVVQVFGPSAGCSCRWRSLFKLDK
jgi:site-specific DNA recombinase